MTIAACYLSPEGVVLGADSASTYAFASGHHHFNYGQKLFEIGDEGEGTLGLVTWGLGGLGLGSYRTQVAKLADSLKVNRPATVLDAANRWIDLVWPIYSGVYARDIQACRVLNAKLPFDAAAPADPTRRTQVEEVQLSALLDALVAGFCIGGYIPDDHQPGAWEIIFDPIVARPIPQQLPPAQSFWGIPAMMNRLIKGCGDEVKDAILASGKWVGTPQDFDTVIGPLKLAHPETVPIREAIDFTHAAILTTVKAMKFSQLPRLCGGPIEIAVITTDRKFRWVMHKSFDSAIQESAS